MPEQPEVAQTVDQLYFLLINKIVLSIKGLRGKFLEIGETEQKENINSDSEDEEQKTTSNFLQNLPLEITDIFYRGKLVFFEFKGPNSKKWWIVNSFRMTGGWRTDKDKYSCVEFTLEPKTENGVFDIDKVYYTDKRMLGTMEFIDESENIEKRINDFNYGFLGRYIITLEDFKKNIKKSKTKGLASAIMDQRSICSGIGNYLLSEIFYDCKMYPHIKCNKLTNKNIIDLYNSSVSIITASYENGGVSVEDFADIYGKKGKHQDLLKVYRKKIDPYGNKVVSEKCNHGRKIFYVPGLQLPEKVSLRINDSDEDTDTDNEDSDEDVIIQFDEDDE